LLREAADSEVRGSLGVGVLLLAMGVGVLRIS
jgi:hypothetical protein